MESFDSGRNRTNINGENLGLVKYPSEMEETQLKKKDEFNKDD